ncbi:MAG: M4 family metallopeptidase [Pseudomonadota bacterium]
MWKSELLSFLLSFLLATAVGAAEPSGPVSKTPSIISPIPRQLISTPEDQAFWIWQDSERVDVVDGQVRSVRLKPNTQVSRAEFFESYAPGLGLGANDQMSEISSRTLDKWGLVQSRFKQQYKGLDVLGADYVLHENDGAVTFAVGKIASGLTLDVTPAISELEALASVADAVGTDQLFESSSEPDYKETPKGQLAVSSENFRFTPESFRLVYRFCVTPSNSFGAKIFDVDAKTAEIVNQMSGIWEEDVAIKGETLYNGTQEFVVGKIPIDVLATPPDIRYRLTVETPEIETLDCPDGAAQTMQFSDIEESVDDDEEHNFQSQEGEVAASVHWGVQQVMSYYRNTFLTPDIEPTKSIIFFKDSPSNCAAATSQNPPILGFRGYEIKVLDKSLPPCVNLETVGHEYTHAVQRMANPGLVNMGETGALMEGFADLFGMFVQADKEGTPPSWCKATPLMSEPCSLNFKEPQKSVWKTYDPVEKMWTSNPDTYGNTPYDNSILYSPCSEKNDFCGIHKNSTILSHWFYLIVDGGEGKNGNGDDYKVVGIGKKNSSYLDLAYLTMTMMPSAATFKDFRVLSIGVAETLYGKDSQEVIAVTNAWHAVGVGDKYQADRNCSPQMGEANVENWKTHLECKPLPSETEWEFQVSPTLDFNSAMLKTVSTSALYTGGLGGAPSVVADLPLESSKIYYWRVRGRYGLQQTAPAPSQEEGVFKSILEGLSKWLGGSREAPPNKSSRTPFSETDEEAEWTDWSPVLSFKTASKQVKLLSPASGSTSQNPWDGKFSWTSIPDAVKYRVQVSESADFAANDEKTTTGLKENFDLKVGKGYYWRVMPVGPDETWGDWSKVSFKTALPVAMLDSPANGAVVSPWGIGLKWKDWKGSVEYHVVVSTNENLTKPLFDETKPKNILGTNLDAVGTEGPFYWAVTPKGPPPYSEWGGLSKGSFTADYNKTKSEAIYPKGVLPFKKPVRFIWKKIPGAVSYQLAICLKKGGCLPNPPSVAGVKHDEQSLHWDSPGSSYSVNKDGYTWNVTAIGPKGYPGNPSSNVSYDIGPPQPVPVSPAHGATNVEYNPTVFQWVCDGCAEYPVDEIHLKISSITGGLGAGGYLASQTQATRVLQPDTGYQWQVCAKKLPNIDICSAIVPSFVTKPGSPQPSSKEGGESGSGSGLGEGQSCPDLGEAVVTSLPAGSHAYYCNTCVTKTSTPNNFTFKWNPVSGAKSYQVEVYVFGGGFVGTKTAQGTQSPPFSLKYWTPYGVNVRAVNSCNKVGEIQGKGIGFYLVP